MASKVADIVTQAAGLDRTERAKVVSQLLNSLEPPGDDVADFEAAWTDELDQRERDMDAGEVELVDWITLRASLRG